MASSTRTGASRLLYLRGRRTKHSGGSRVPVMAEGYADKTSPYHGCRFRILKRQGPSARLGAVDHVIGGKMIGGFALGA